MCINFRLNISCASLFCPKGRLNMSCAFVFCSKGRLNMSCVFPFCLKGRLNMSCPKGRKSVLCPLDYLCVQLIYYILSCYFPYLSCLATICPVLSIYVLELGGKAGPSAQHFYRSFGLNLSCERESVLDPGSNGSTLFLTLMGRGSV